jgi:MFS family permease
MCVCTNAEAAMRHERAARTVAMSAAMQGIGGGLGWSLAAALLPDLSKDLGLTKATAGLAWGAASLGIALAAPLGGAAVDRFGPRRVAGVAMLAGAVACAARAACTGPWSLVLAMLLFGAHVGFVAPSIPKALAGEVPAAKLGSANGTALLAYTLTTAATMLLARTVLAPALGGWRPTMVVAGAAMAVVGVVWLRALRDRVLAGAHEGVRSVLRMLHHRELRKVAVMHFFLFGGYLALLGALPHALADAGLPPMRVGAAIGAWLVCAALANLGGPWLSDKLGLRKPVLAVGAALAGLALAGLAAGAGPWTLVVAAAGGGCVAPLLLTLPLEMDGVGLPRAGAALGLLMLVGQAGGALLPSVTGAIAQRSGFPWALGVLAGAHLLVSLPALALRETGRNARREAAAELSVAS